MYDNLWLEVAPYLPGWGLEIGPSPHGGHCVWAARKIVIDPRLTRREARSIIRHEAVHAVRGPFPAWMEAREEELVSRLAARCLLPCLEHVTDALAWAPSIDEAAEILDVDTPTLEARLRGLSDHEWRELRHRMDLEEDTA